MSWALVLRLAGPLQAWGSSSQFNRRETDEVPTKSGIVGLLAAAQGRSRYAPIDDLVSLSVGVRADQPGSLLRDFHTVSSMDGSPLPSATMSAKGTQKPTSPKKLTHVTERFYLQDAIFVVVVGGPDLGLLTALAEAVRHPVFPLALGRRSCVPTQPLVLPSAEGDLWLGDTLEVLGRVPWQASDRVQRRASMEGVELAVVADRAYLVPEGALLDTSHDVPVSFAPGRRHMRTREVVHVAVTIPSGRLATAPHDPFDLLRGIS